jgi:hypothetical protein
VRGYRDQRNTVKPESQTRDPRARLCVPGAPPPSVRCGTGSRWPPGPPPRAPICMGRGAGRPVKGSISEPDRAPKRSKETMPGLCKWSVWLELDKHPLGDTLEKELVAH